MARVGVLALQGDFAEHITALRRLNVEASEVRSVQEIGTLGGLVIPGGESTTMARLMEPGLAQALIEKATNGFPIWGTCAGMILLARELAEERPRPLGLIDLKVRRNAFGRQVDSFETDIPVPALGDVPFHAVFIRAPCIVEVGPRVDVLARLQDGTPVAARQGNIMVTSFHPELTPDTRFHAYFLKSLTEKVAHCDTLSATH